MMMSSRFGITGKIRMNLTISFTQKKKHPRETLRKEVVSLVLYLYKTNDTLHRNCESVIVGYIL